jgi:hypothetical protein
MNIQAANTSLTAYTRFQIQPDSGLWYSVTCDNSFMIGGFSSVQDAYMWAVKEESALCVGV